MTSLAQVQEASDFVLSETSLRPCVAVVLGSGLGGLLEGLEARQSVPYALIPHCPQPSVEGHQGELVFGRMAGVSMVAMRGRVHLYEGYTAADVAFPIRLLRALGCHTLVVTNAAGALNPAFRPADLMLIEDHVFLPGLTGASPLLGDYEPHFGPRFVAMAQAYDQNLRQLAHEVGRRLSIPLQEGVYAMVAGPHYETSAEARLLRAAGADAVGMSTCPEVVVARQVGMRILGISVITNNALGYEEDELGHLQVLSVAASAGTGLSSLLEGVIATFQP
jgi:purine-nucleoside phosphorylase